MIIRGKTKENFAPFTLEGAARCFIFCDSFYCPDCIQKRLDGDPVLMVDVYHGECVHCEDCGTSIVAAELAPETFAELREVWRRMEALKPRLVAMAYRIVSTPDGPMLDYIYPKTASEGENLTSGEKAFLEFGTTSTPERRSVKL